MPRAPHAAAALALAASASLAAPPEDARPYADAALVQPSASSEGLWCFAPARRSTQAAYERDLNALVSAASLADIHEALTLAPHPAGSEGDLAVIAYLEEAFDSLGLVTEAQWLDLYLSKPRSARLELVLADAGAGASSEMRMPLPVMEPPIEGDPFTADERLDIGWNAYAATGDVTAEVVYANYGTKEDFERLDEMGISVEGKIVIARYGRNFRGYKAKFAEARGAAGLIMYSDPEDVGYGRGVMYPEGGYANGDQIQRGSIKTVPYPGDPLTPGYPAVPDAVRIDPEGIGLPTIPVQPIGWNAAAPILRSMAGEVVPHEWQGALPFNYRLTSGEGVRVRLAIEQERGLHRTANVTGTLVGARFPEEVIVVGGHHDAWTHGAGDPGAGLMLIVESARAFAEMAERGQRPDRTIIFAGWAAEEYGLIGSTEWVEANAERLSERCLAYLNLDMSAMGPGFTSSAAPPLKQLVIDATRDVRHLQQPGMSVHGAWSRRIGTPEPSVGTMGGGSDHVGFYCHLAVPSMSLGAWGSRGVSYHSTHDNLNWYRQVVGDDYKPGVMLTHVTNLVLARLASADVIPYSPSRYAEDLPGHLATVKRRADALGVDLDPSALDGPIERLAAAAEWCERRMVELAERGERHRLAEANRMLVQLERAWRFEGLEERPFYRSLWVATDRDSGYAAWMLPHLRAAVEARDPAKIDAALGAYERAIDRLIQKLEAVAASS
jgi:N-acetylated-alpha-linked acidic dipeptidase